MNHLDAIEKGLTSKKSPNEIARKVYLSYPTHALIGYEDKQYEIVNEISCHFSIPIMSIQVAGSAKTGYSFHQKTNFCPKESDLDIAIINSSLYQKYAEIVFRLTEGYSDMSKFDRNKKGISKANEYISNITKGMFRPDLMPSCPERNQWFSFFYELSRKHDDLFKSINAGIYMSQIFFEYKQKNTITNYKMEKGI
jgi:hypothetical protein